VTTRATSHRYRACSASSTSRKITRESPIRRRFHGSLPASGLMSSPAAPSASRASCAGASPGWESRELGPPSRLRGEGDGVHLTQDHISWTRHHAHVVMAFHHPPTGAARHRRHSATCAGPLRRPADPASSSTHGVHREPSPLTSRSAHRRPASEDLAATPPAPSASQPLEHPAAGKLTPVRFAPLGLGCCGAKNRNPVLALSRQPHDVPKGVWWFAHHSQLTRLSQMTVVYTRAVLADNCLT